MARILQHDLFGWQGIRQLPDIARMRLALDGAEDEALVCKIEQHRGKGRDDYPVRPMLNLVLLFPLTGHRTWQAYLRELGRNRDLMALAGFAPGSRVPTGAAVCRFLKVLRKFQNELDAISDRIIDKLAVELPDLGEHLGVDSQAVNSLARKASDRVRKDGQPDERGEHDAENSRKVSTVDEKEVTHEWFGFKNHLLCDVRYQLPLFSLVDKGTSSDTTNMRPLVEEFIRRHPQLASRIRDCVADMGYDSQDNILGFRELSVGGEFLCPTRKLWKNPDFRFKDDFGKETLLKILPGKGNEDLCYDQDGQIYCAYEKELGQWKFYPMVFKGYEDDRKALKYVCRMASCGCQCPGIEPCTKGLGRAVRVKLETDPRIFVPTPRHTLKFQRRYARRTAVERINRLYQDLFEIKDMKVRGKASAALRVSLMRLTVLSMALARIRNGQRAKMRSIVAAA